MLARIARFVWRQTQLLRYRHDEWMRNALLVRQAYPEETRLSAKGIRLQSLGLDLPRGQGTFLLESLERARRLVSEGGAKFAAKSSAYHIEIGGLHFEVQTIEDLYILDEVFLDGYYNFSLPSGSQRVIVIDIGMNVAFASCYFAIKPEVEKVLSFEPFGPTFAQAQKHIGWNGLLDKVEAKNVGLGLADETLSVAYSPKHRGSVGVVGTDLIRVPVTDATQVPITIKETESAILAILAEYPNHEFVVKIDCEGAEYEILPRLPDSLLRRTRVVMLEWHVRGPEPLTQHLQQRGFATLSRNPHSTQLGFIYAVRTS